MWPEKPDLSLVKVKLELIDVNCQPRMMRDGDACHDIVSRVDITIPAGEVKKVPAGFRVELPKGYRMDVRSRSSWSAKGIIVANSPGTIDSGYRDEVIVLLLNVGREPVHIRKYDRIAQALIAKNLDSEWLIVNKIDHDGDRGGGFGSTGRQ